MEVSHRQELSASTDVRCFRKTTYGSMAEIHPRILVRRLKRRSLYRSTSPRLDGSSRFLAIVCPPWLENQTVKGIK